MCIIWQWNTLRKQKNILVLDIYIVNLPSQQRTRPGKPTPKPQTPKPQTPKPQTPNPKTQTQKKKNFFIFFKNFLKKLKISRNKKKK